jgi:polysaccharide export outer membrane protein
MRGLVAIGSFLSLAAIMFVLSSDVRGAKPAAATRSRIAGYEAQSGAPAEGVPRELAMRPFPAYRIQPPDGIALEMLKLVPLGPYRAGYFDVLQIRANAPPDQPIDNYYMIEADGTVNLGPQYGPVRVLGMKVDEIRAALEKSLRQYLGDPSPSVQLARVSGAQPVTGQYLVSQDGKINLRRYGQVEVMGMTVEEAQKAIEKHLAKYLESPEVSVDVTECRSKLFYVITQSSSQGDSVRRVPSTGNETVLDAIGQINGLSQLSSRRIWIARPSASSPEKGTILSVDWDAITSRGATATNYQVLPGDRIFIAEKDNTGEPRPGDATQKP